MNDVINNSINRINEVNYFEDEKLNYRFKKNLLYYLNNSTFTDISMYSNLINDLPNDIESLCCLIRFQLIHPEFYLTDIRNNPNNFLGDTTKIPINRLNNEEELFPTANSMFLELLRRNPDFSDCRDAKDKLNVTCRGHNLMLLSILKQKGIPCRLRCGFAKYLKDPYVWEDQYNVEYFDFKNMKWIYVDANSTGNDGILKKSYLNVPKDLYLTPAEAWIMYRNNRTPQNVKFKNAGGWFNDKAIWVGMLYDLNCLMQNEIPFNFGLKFMYTFSNNKMVLRDLNDEDIKEMDIISNLLIDVDKNFSEIKKIYDDNPKYSILLGTTVWNK